MIYSKDNLGVKVLKKKPVVTLWEVSLRIDLPVSTVKRISSFAPILTLDYFMHLAEVLQHMFSRFFFCFFGKEKPAKQKTRTSEGQRKKKKNKKNCVLLKERKKAKIQSTQKNCQENCDVLMCCVSPQKHWFDFRLTRLKQPLSTTESIK